MCKEGEPAEQQRGAARLWDSHERDIVTASEASR